MKLGIRFFTKIMIFIFLFLSGCSEMATKFDNSFHSMEGWTSYQSNYRYKQDDTDFENWD